MRILRVPVGILAKVLVFVLVSAVLTVALGVLIGNYRPFERSYPLEAEFSDATGVFVGDAVKVAGVDVGRVSGTRVEDGKAVVTFDVRDDVRLTDQSTVAIRWRNVLGLRFLYLDPGAGRRELEPGERIPDERTDEAGDLSAFLNRLGPILRAIDPQKANAFLDAMNTALAGNEAAVRVLLSSGAVLSAELGDMDREIRSLIRSSDTILEAYASQEQAIGTIIDDLDVIGGQLGGATDSINSLIVNLAGVQEEMERLLSENREHIDADLLHMRRIAGTLARNRDDLARTLCTLPPGVAPYFVTTSWGQWFNVRIVEAVVKDPDGTIIASESEQPGQRAPRGPPVIECPRGVPVEVFSLSGSASTRTAPADPPATTARSGLDTWLDGVLRDA